LVSLFLIFFVGRSTDPITGKRQFALTTNGVSEFRKGLDVSGGTKLAYKISYDKYEGIYTNPAELAAVKKTIETIILKNIDNRISKLGVADYKSYIQTLDGQNYIVVEIGGIADLDQAKEIIGKTVELEFKLQNKAPITPASIAARKDVAQKILSEAIVDPTVLSKSVQGRASENIFANYFSGATLAELPEIYKNNPQYLDSLKSGQVSNVLLDGKYTTVQTQTKVWSTGVTLNGFVITQMIQKGSKTLSGKTETTYSFIDVFVQDHESWIQAVDNQGNVLNGAYFKYANTSSSQVGEPVVAINFDDKGKDIFCSLTEQNIGQPMAIFVGGELLTSPTIQAKICGGTAQIDGSFTSDSAKELATSLNDGAMPAPLILMQEEKISPSLGTNALTGALFAGLIWCVAISLLMWAMYGWKKMVLTAIVLTVFISVLAAFLKVSDYALSLSGIAAIILSIGMAVDGNVLIYERLREEIKRGLSIEGAIDTAKDRSWTAIRDGQLSTGLIALVLFSMGVSLFRGFGLMMLVTLCLSLFLNVPLTKILLHVFYDRKKTK